MSEAKGMRKIMIFYKNSLFLILLLSALYLSGCEKTQNNGSILYYEQNKFEVDIKQLIDNRYYIINLLFKAQSKCDNI